MSQKRDNTVLPIWALLRRYKDKKQENQPLPSLRELLGVRLGCVVTARHSHYLCFVFKLFLPVYFFSQIFLLHSFLYNLLLQKIENLQEQPKQYNKPPSVYDLASTITGSQPISSCFKFHTSLQFAYYFEENSRFIISSVNISVCTLRGNGSLKHYKSKSAFIVFYSFFVLYLKVNKNNYQMLH